MRKVSQEGIETIQRGSPGKGLPNGKRGKTGLVKGQALAQSVCTAQTHVQLIRRRLASTVESAN